MTTPYSFDEFFASNQEETISPFLTPDSRKWGKSLPLRSAILAALLLAVAYCLSFISPMGSALTLSMVYLLVGTPALINSLKDLSRWDINIDVLMTLAALLSVIIGSEMEGALLLVLFELSAGMEMVVGEKTRSSVLRLSHLSPKSAWVVGDQGHLIEQSIREIAVGTIILVKAGEVIPLDGVVVEGRSFVNLVYLTGESGLLSKQVGNEVPAGASNLDGTLTIRVTRSSGDSTLS
ncbi:MAG: heavy metal translocating P-type ATPase, partial [Rhabdochlamydiaceae bacterium]